MSRLLMTAAPTHVGLTLIGTILFALSVIFRVWG